MAALHKKKPIELAQRLHQKKKEKKKKKKKKTPYAGTATTTSSRPTKPPNHNIRYVLVRGPQLPYPDPRCTYAFVHIHSQSLSHHHVTPNTSEHIRAHHNHIRAHHITSHPIPSHLIQQPSDPPTLIHPPTQPRKKKQQFHPPCLSNR
ncbi:hypothetical protein P171DRAFT_111621 [Karstenula rhodostoma CBS 690.94]|uniref:Uncharacterized protein n=1 Tax=Karstenula rhodostoma CBS 690.94 TaxID=1392251 RepID=A0A9P4P7F3_9PLEO|nr:hypothetical protein P171DRAFT_111621 [Karstenula rhodostoma CBS 690.94]